MAEAADADDGDALSRLGIGPAQPRPDGVTGAEDRRRLLVGNSLRQQHRRVGEGQHVLGVTARHLRAGADLFGAEHRPAALAPFAAAAGELDPRHADAVADAARGHARADAGDLSDGLMAKGARKRPGQLAARLMHVGVAQAARVNPDENLPRPRLRGRHVVDFPARMRRRNNCGLHPQSSLSWSWRSPWRQAAAAPARTLMARDRSCQLSATRSRRCALARVVIARSRRTAAPPSRRRTPPRRLGSRAREPRSRRGRSRCIDGGEAAASRPARMASTARPMSLRRTPMSSRIQSSSLFSWAMAILRRRRRAYGSRIDLRMRSARRLMASPTAAGNVETPPVEGGDIVAAVAASGCRRPSSKALSFVLKSSIIVRSPPSAPALPVGAGARTA